MSIFKELKDRKLTASDKLIFLFLSENKNSTYVEICQQLELSINTVKAGLKKLVENNLIERNRSGNLHSTKIVPCFTTENRAQHKFCTMYEYKNYHSTDFVPCYNSDNYLLKSNSYAMAWYKNCTMLWELERKEAKERYIYINTYINSININIISIEGKSSLTSFASTSLKYYIGKFDFVNDLDHRNINQIQNSLIPTEPAKASLAEIAKAPAKRKRAKAQFDPPTAEQVEEYMKQYVEKKSAKIPKLLTIDLAILSEQFIARYEDDWSEVKNWKNKTITFLGNEIKWNKNQKIYVTKRRKNQDAIEEIFGKGLEPETNIIDAVQTENADGSVLYDASSSNQITAQPAEEAELSADEYIRRFKKGEIK